MLMMTPVTGLCETVGPFIALVRWLLGLRGARWTPTPKLAGGVDTVAATERNPRRLGHAEVEETPVPAAAAVEVVEPVAVAAAVPVEVELTGTAAPAPPRRSKRGRSRVGKPAS